MKVYTVTFGDVAENHVGMQKIGKLAEHGYSCAQITSLREKIGLECKVIDLASRWSGEGEAPEACVMVIKRGVQHILGTENTSELIAEHDTLSMDKKAFMRGRVVNKHARWNLCFADEDQEPSYADGKGRIVSYRHIPLTQKIRKTISEWMGDEMLNGEANYYYDISKCGISYHGDSERHKVFAVRMGESMPIYFQWFQKSKPVGERIKIDLDDGDMYIMSEKAVGTDWMKKIVPTLRHATGCDKFTVIKA